MTPNLISIVNPTLLFNVLPSFFFPQKNLLLSFLLHEIRA